MSRRRVVLAAIVTAVVASCAGPASAHARSACPADATLIPVGVAHIPGMAERDRNRNGWVCMSVHVVPTSLRAIADDRPPG